jgi:hypothetical protein
MHVVIDQNPDCIFEIQSAGCSFSGVLPHLKIAKINGLSSPGLVSVIHCFIKKTRSHNMLPLSTSLLKR